MNFVLIKMNEVKEKILTEDKILNKKTEDLAKEWDKEQPQSVKLFSLIFFSQ